MSARKTSTQKVLHIDNLGHEGDKACHGLSINVTDTKRTRGVVVAAIKLTDSIVRDLEKPEAGNRITYDTEVKGFGCRVTAAGARSFILNYRTRSGRERRYTIGAFPDWKVAVARGEARELKRAVDRGEDPLAIVEADRGAKTFADLAKQFREDFLPKKRPSTVKNYNLLLDKFILPQLRHHKVAGVTYSDVDGLHRKITRGGAPYQANRSMAVLSKMFALAVKWGWRPDNPARGIERNPEEKRHRYLSPAELVKLIEALSTIGDQQGANVIRLLMLTGARSGEAMSATWDQFDLKEGVWTKPGSTTKQKTRSCPTSRTQTAEIIDFSSDLKDTSRSTRPVVVAQAPRRAEMSS